MAKVSEEMIHTSYEVGKKLFNNQTSLKEGINVLTNMGMNQASAHFSITNYSYLIQGKLFTRTVNSYATDYSLGKILEENGESGLINALLSLSQHIDYYEDVTGSMVKKKREIYAKYSKLIQGANIEPVYPDELEEDIEYAEGKTKQVVVNSYERNSMARRKCVEHYGYNCQVCDLNFNENYGELGKDFIHVHHKIDIATIGKEYSVDPIEDLVPVCPNCHSMLHKKTPAYSIKELKEIIVSKSIL